MHFGSIKNYFSLHFDCSFGRFDIDSLLEGGATELEVGSTGMQNGAFEISSTAVASFL